MEFIIFLTVTAVIILLIKVIKLSNKSRSAEKEIKNLNRQIYELNNKADYMYSCLKEMGGVPGYPKKEQGSVFSSVNQNDAVILNKTSEESADDISVEFAVNPESEIVSETQYTEITEEKIDIEKQIAEEKQYFQAAESVDQTHSDQAAVPYGGALDEGIVRQAAISNNTGHKKKPVTSKRNIEEWLGARLFNIAASLLIFIGLILFCTLGTDQVTNTMKMIALFTVSGGFIAAGAFLSLRDKSVFPLGMLGCGFGTFFISILVSHVYFHSLNDVFAFGLILVWSAFALFMSKRLDSVMLSVTAHIGTAVSICFAFTLGFTAERIILLTLYQLAAITVIVAGNIFCCKKTYRFGLIMSQLLFVYTSIAMNNAFSEKFIMPQSIPVAAVVAVYAVQLAALSFISYLVSISAESLEKESININPSKHLTLSRIIHVTNKLLWTLGMLLTVGRITYFICKNAIKIDPSVPITAVLCISAFLHLAITLTIKLKRGFSEQLTAISLWFTSFIICFSLISGSQRTGLPFVMIFTLLMVGVFKLTKIRSITPICCALLLTEAVYMTFYGFFAAKNVWVSIPYMFAICVVLLLLWFAQSGKEKKRYLKYLKISEYIWISVSIISINCSELSDISFPLIMSEFALMNLICFFVKFGRENEHELRMAVKAESILTIYIGIVGFVLENVNELGDNSVIKAVMVVMIAAITAVYVRELALSSSTGLQTISAVTVVCFVTFLSSGFSEHFKLFDIYSNVLENRPFVLIFAAALLLIYALNKNHKLAKIVWIGIIIDMIMSVAVNYQTLIIDLPSYDKANRLAIHIVMSGVCLAHAAGMMGCTFLMGSLSEEESNTFADLKIIPKYVSYFWLSISFPVIICYAFQETKLSEFSGAASMLILIIINTAVYAFNYQGKRGTPFNITVDIFSDVVFYIAMVFFADGRKCSAGVYFACAVLILACTALFFVKTHDMLKSSSSIWLQVYVGIKATIFVNAACYGLSDSFDYAYVFSIVSMITALLCIISGFIIKTKGLRIYGLIVVMLCIIKLVTVDIRGADSLSRVIAFIAGGIICFIISGIYNMMEKKLSAVTKNE